MTRNAPVQTSLLIPAAIRVAMRAADASTASTSATYLETVLPEGHESVFMEVCFITILVMSNTDDFT